MKPLIAFLLLASSFSPSAWSETPRPDYDVDNDGLIEINDLNDLDAIRNSPKGDQLHGASVGCPDSGCVGFELTGDLDFDTNGDGKMDAQDAYWNNGRGWKPLCNSNWEFQAILDGNGHHIRNLYINANVHEAGLFCETNGAQIRKLQLDGPLMSLTGVTVGAITGSASDTLFSELVIKGTIKAKYFAGALAGEGHGSANNRAEGVVIASHIYTPYDSFIVVGDEGFAVANSLIVGSAVLTAWSVDDLSWRFASTAQQVVMQVHVQGLDDQQIPEVLGPVQSLVQLNKEQSPKLTQAQLQCGLNSQCNGGANFSGWETQKGSDGAAYWDFGNGQQAPGLRILGKVFRDSDGDAVFDEDDAFPLFSFASVDQDKDGAADTLLATCDATCWQGSGVVLDQLPNNPAAALDADQDGWPDAWAASCDASCQGASGLTLDAYPNDSDNDGIPNSQDTDDRQSGQTDADSDSDGLIEVRTLADLNAIRFAPDGAGRVLQAGGAVNASGCPQVYFEGRMQQRCRGFELAGHLDFDTNQDGVLNAQDTYWNPDSSLAGNGWQPIGYFSGHFNGNGFQISNLYSRAAGNKGLFDHVNKARIENLVIAGPHTRLAKNPENGGLAGLIAARATASYFQRLVVSGQINAAPYGAGGVVGRAEQCEFNQVFSATEQQGASLNGLIGEGHSNRITSGLATGTLRLAEGGSKYTTITARMSLTRSLIARVNASTQPFTFYLDNPNKAESTDSYFHNPREVTATAANTFSLAALSCPTQADSTECPTPPMYVGWGQDKNEQGQPLWNFGSKQQLPGFNLFGKIFRDGDGDGVLDQDDHYPAQFAVSVDSDNDGAADRWTPGCDTACQSASSTQLDLFPTQAAASIDADLDGLPDSWAANCDTTCRTQSGLKLDPLLDDSDNDHTPNGSDSDDDNDGRIDVDADSNGLIDINTLADLDAVRFNPQGTSRKLGAEAFANASGCPLTLVDGYLVRTCQGYELKADLDFDSNQNGKMDSQDAYWNSGSGWNPLGAEYNPLSTRIEGNNHTIRNLWINRLGVFNQGLFGYVVNSRIEHLALSGPLTRVVGDSAGLLVGDANQVVINEVAITGQVQGAALAGGLIAFARDSQINAVYASVNVQSNAIAAGLIGTALDTGISNAFVAGFVQGGQGTAGVVGGLSINAPLSINNVSNSLSLANLASTDSTASALGETVSATNSHTNNSIMLPRSETTPALTLSRLQCPTAANNTLCGEPLLYGNWDKAQNSSGKSYWVFGNGKQLPALLIHNKTYRDSDGDGRLDPEDAFPLSPAAVSDQDKDGAPDAWALGCTAQCRSESGLTLDAFPTDKAAQLDADLDGRPDAWAPQCDSSCQASSKLKLDTRLNDLDNDGISDGKDEDDDNNGQLDADLDGNGLVEISSLAQLNAIRFDIAGHGRALKQGTTDSTGCPKVIVNGLNTARCQGYELKQNLDFDTDQDGRITRADAYNTDNKGWVALSGIAPPPLKGDPVPFSGIFDGQGFAIRNLTSINGQGLFYSLLNAQVKRLVLDGPLMNIQGSSSHTVGAVASQALQSQLSEIVVTGWLRGDLVGGLVGNAYSTHFNAVVSTARIEGYNTAGGIAGRLDKDSSIRNALSSGWLSSDPSGVIGTPASFVAGGLSTDEGALYTSLSSRHLDIKGGIYSGTAPSPRSLNATYFVSDWVANSAKERGAATLAQLQCGTQSSVSRCAGTLLYDGWEKILDSNGQPYWDFGSSTELPGLRLFGKIWRDGDGDGVLEITPATEVNLAPSLALSLTQAGKTVKAAVAGEGDIQIEAQAKDPNAGDKLTYAWILDGKPLTETSHRLSLNSQTLAVGAHQVNATVTDNGTPIQRTHQTLSFELKAAPVVAGAMDWRYLLLLTLCLAMRKVPKPGR
ncbi:MAG: hypothetical protein RL497_1362 [Pseudomonadota bacterium]|jgi:hypothetical protein